MHRLKVSLLCLISLSLAGSVFGQTAPQPESGGVATYDSYSGGATMGSGTYFNARYMSGDGVGYQQGYSQLGVFVPFWLNDNALIAPDVRLMLTNYSGVGGNIGGVARNYFESIDRIVGAAAYFDMDQSSNRNNYTQGTFGLETLGQYWDLRGNYYYAPGNQDNFVSNGAPLCVSGNPFFSGNNIVFQGQQGQFREQAMSGFDLEFGMPVFQSTPWLRAYAGTYYYKANQVAPPMSVNIANQTDSNPWGFRGRLDAWIADDLLVGVNVTTDSVWGTNVNGVVDFRFSGFRPTRYFPQWTTRERMLAPWQRNWRIAVEQYQTAQNTDVVAINPNTGKPYFVSFVNGDNPTAGTGTFEDPFKSFNHPNGIPGADIIYVARDGSTAANPYIGTMKLFDNQILLGEGGTMKPLALSAAYGNCSVNGNFVLPGVDGSGNYPWVSAPGGHAIGLANNNEVSGFHIINSVDGIVGTNINNSDLRNLDIHNNSGRGINLTNVGGAVNLLDVNSSNNGTGIFLSETNKSLVASFLDVTASGNLGRGVDINGTGGSVTVNANDAAHPLIANNNGGNNLNIGMNGTSFLGNFTSSKFNGSTGGSGVGYTQVGGNGTLNLTNVTANGNGIDGITQVVSGAGTTLLNTNGSQFNSNIRDGIHTEETGGAAVTNNVLSSLLNSNGRDGYFYNLAGNSMLNATFTDDQLNSNTRSGFFGLMNDSTATFNISNTLATNSVGGNGFALDAANGSVFNATASNVAFSNSGMNGMSFGVHGSSTANFSGTGIADNSNIQSGVSFAADTGSTFGLTAFNSSFNSNNANGVVGTAATGSTANLEISNGSTINNNAQNGVFVTTTGLSNVLGTFNNTSINGNMAGNGIYFNMDNSPASSLTLSGTTTLNSNGANGLRIDASTGTVFTPSLVGTTIQNNALDGVLFNASSGSSIGTSGNPAMLTNVTIQNNSGNGLETNATGPASVVNVTANNTKITDTLGQQKVGFQFDATSGGQVTANFINGSALDHNVQNAVNGNVTGAGSVATVTLNGTNASNSGLTNAAMAATAGGVLNFNASNGASFSNSVNGGGLLIDVDGINSVANVELDGITADGNKAAGFAASANDAVAPGVGQNGATLNVCLQSSSFSNNTLQGLSIVTNGPGALARYGVGVMTPGTGVTINGNGQQGLFTQTTNGSEIDYRSIGSSYDNNGNGATKFDGVDMRVDGTGSTLRALFSAGTANGNGRDGLHFGGLTDGGSTNGADITVSLSDGTTSSGNGRYSLNFDANGANTAYLVEDPLNPPVLVGPINLDYTNVGTAVANLAGEFHFDGMAGNGFAATFAGATTVFFSLDGQGNSTADNNALDGISIDVNNVTNASVYIGGFSSISGNGGNGIHVGMTNVTNGALQLQGIAGGTTMTGNGANGIDVQLNNVNLVNNFSTTVVSPNVIGLTTTDNQSFNACLPLPVVLPVNAGVIVPATGLTIDSFNVASSGAGGIIVDGVDTTIAPGGAITNNTVTGSLGGDGIQLSLHNAALVNPTADNFVLTGNSSTGNSGNGINIDLLNATMNNLDMSGTTTVNDNGGDGLLINLVNSSMTPTADIGSLLASGNGGDGVSISAATNSAISLDFVSLTANNNTGAGFVGSALSGSSMNVCLDGGSVSNNGAEGLNLTINGTGSIANINLGPIANLAGTGIAVNGNTNQGLLATVAAGGVLNYRSINSTYNNNGTTTANDGIDLRVNGAGSELRTLFYGGSANNNGRDGLHVGGLTDGGSVAGADITTSLANGFSSTGNIRDSLNFNVNNANTAYLLMDAAPTSTFSGPINLDYTNVSSAIANLSGVFHLDNGTGNGLTANFSNATTALFAINGNGTSTASGNALGGFDINMTNVTNGLVTVSGFSDISNNVGGDGISVGMTNVTSGALNLQGVAAGTTMANNGGNGINVQLSDVNLLNGLPGISTSITGLTTTDSFNVCLPSPVTLAFNGTTMDPANGFKVDNFTVSNSGAGGIIVDGTDTTIASGGSLSNNTVSGSLGGDGIQLSLHNAALVNPTADNFVMTGNSSTGNSGNGINIDLLNATMNNLDMSGTTTVNDNGGDGLLINLVNSSMVMTKDIDSLLASGNGGDGVSISTATNSNIAIDFASLTANSNTGSGFVGSALSGSTLNVCIDGGSASLNQTEGINLTVDGAGSIANVNLGPVDNLAGTGVSVNGNTNQGLLATVTNTGVLNYRSINSTYNDNGTTTANDGVDMRVNGAGSTINTLFYGGSANGNGRDGYHFGGLTDAGSTAGATLTVSLSGVTSTGNVRNALNFDPLDAANANLLMDSSNPSTIAGNVAGLNDSSTVTNEVVLNLEGLSFLNGLNLNFDNGTTGINYAYVSLDGQGTSTIDDGLSVTMNGLVAGSVRLVDYASVTNTAGDAIAVTMDGSTSAAGQMDGAIEIQGAAGSTAVNTTNGSGVNITLNDTNLLNGLTAPPINIQVLTTTSTMASPLDCLPLPTNLLFTGITPANGLTIADLNVTGTTGLNGISVVGTNSTIATGGSVTGNTIGGTFSGDGINVSMTNTAATAAMMDGLVVTGNTVGGTIGGDGIRVQDLNTGATGSAADNITIGSNTVTGVTGDGIAFVVTDPTASTSTANNLQIINNTVKTSGGNALAVNLNNAKTDTFTTSGNSLDTSTLNGFALGLNNSTITSWVSTGGDITGNTQNGLVVTNSNASSILSATLDTLLINNNGADGVQFTTTDATKSIFGEKATGKTIAFTNGSISNNGATTTGNGVNLTTLANGSVANLVFTNETIGNTAIGGTQQNGLVYNIAATGGTADAVFTGGSINNNAVDAINGTINGTGALNGAESTITLNGVAANGSGSTGAAFVVNDMGALTLVVQDNAGTGSSIDNSGADGIKITATGTGTVANATVLNSSVSNNGRTAAGNGLTLNLDDSATSTLTVTNSTIGNTAIGGTQDNGVLLNLNQTLVGANTNLIANFTNSTLSNNSVSALDAEIVGASTTNNTTPALTGAQIQALAGAHITLNAVTAAGSGANGMLFNVNGGANPAQGGVLELTSTNGTAITGSGTNGILLNAHDATTLVSMSLQNTSVTGNGVTSVGDGLQANVTAGARFNLEASSAGSPLSFSNNTGNGINVQTSDANSRSDLDLFTATVNSNTLNGLIFNANNGGAVNLRAYDTTFDLNKLGGMTGTVTQTAGTDTSGIVSIIGGEANNNGTTVLGDILQSGYSLTASNSTGNLATITGQFQPDKTNSAVSATGNKGYGINFVAGGNGTVGNLLMSGNTTLSGNTLGALHVDLSSMDKAIVQVSGVFDNNVKDGIDVALSNVNLGVVAITGGEVKNNGGYGINVNLTDVLNGGVLIGGLTDVSSNGTANGAGGLGQDGIHVTMNNVGTGAGGNYGALTIDGQNGNPSNVMNVSNNTGNGVSVAITGTSVIDNSNFSMGGYNPSVIDYQPGVALGTTPNPIIAAPLPNPLLTVVAPPVPGITFSNSTEIHGLTMDNNGNSTGLTKTGNGILFAVDGATGATVNNQIIISNNAISNTGSASTTSTHAGVALQLTNGANVVGVDLVENSITGTKGDGFQMLLPTYVTPANPLAINFTRDSITGNTLNGVDISMPSLVTTAPQIDLVFTNDTISSNGANGVLLGLANNPNSNAVANVSFLSDSTTANPFSGKKANDISNNTGMGVFLNMAAVPPSLANNASLNLTIGGTGDVNTFNGNGDAGVGISLSGNAAAQANVTNASFTNTVARGLAGTHFSGDGFAVFLNNSATFNDSTFGNALPALSNTTFSNNNGSGFRIDTSLSGSVNNLEIQNSTFNGNGGNGLTFLRNAGVPVPGPYITNVSIHDNTITQNANGISIAAEFADGADTYTINNNTINSNRSNGVTLSTTADADLTVNFTSNTISANNLDGINARQNLGSSDLSVITSTILDNTITNNLGDGIDYNASHALVIGSIAAPNLINGNSGDGIAITGTSETQDGFGFPQAFVDQIINNAISNNGANGINITVAGQGIVLPQGSFEQVNIDGNNHFSTVPGGGFGGINNNGGDGIRLTNIGGKLGATVNNNDVLSSGGDGIQLLNSTAQINNVAITSNDIDTSGGRGINVLNAANSETNLQIDSNIVARSFLEGVYIVNTSTNGSLGTGSASVQGVDALANATMAIDNTWLNDPELALTMHGNTITSNGQAANAGTLFNASGLVVRVGSSGATQGAGQYTDNGGFASTYNSASLTDATVVSVANMTRGGVVGNIFNNAFTGQYNADVTFQAFTSTTPPPTTGGQWTDQNQGDSAATPPVPRNPADDVFNVTSFTTDPLSRLDLRFTSTNTGEAAIVTRTDFFGGGNGVYNNAEGTFKSRTSSVDGNDPPVGGNNASNVQNGDDGGPFNSATRDRNITRQASQDPPFNTPTGVTSNNQPVPAGTPNQINVSVNGFLYSGTGASTFRRTNDSSTAGFNLIPAGTSFTDQVGDPQGQVGALSFRWDTF